MSGTPMNRRALLLGALACVSWSTVFVLGRFAISRHAADPVVLGLYRFALTGLVLAVAMMVIPHPPPSQGGGRGRVGALGGLETLLVVFLQEPWRFLALGLTGGFAMGFLVFLALQQTNSVVVQIVMNSNPVLIVPLSLLIGERVGLAKVAGVALGVGGCVLVLSGVSPEVAQANPNHVLGGVLAALSGLAWAAYTVFGRPVVQRHGALVTTTLCMVIGGVAFLIACLAMGKSLVLPWQGAVVGVYLALVPTVFGFTAWYIALEKLPANVLGPLQFIVPIGGVALAILLLGETLTAVMVLGGVLALGGVYLSTREAS